MSCCFENSQILRYAIWDTEHTDFTEHADVYLCPPCVLCPKVTGEHFHVTWVRRKAREGLFRKQTNTESIGVGGRNRGRSRNWQSIFSNCDFESRPRFRPPTPSAAIDASSILDFKYIGFAHLQI
jgi:hypothetical protein